MYIARLTWGTSMGWLSSPGLMSSSTGVCSFVNFTYRECPPPSAIWSQNLKAIIKKNKIKKKKEFRTQIKYLIVNWGRLLILLTWFEEQTNCVAKQIEWARFALKFAKIWILGQSEKTKPPQWSQLQLHGPNVQSRNGLGLLLYSRHSRIAAQ